MKRYEYRAEVFLDAHGAHNPLPPHQEIVARLNMLGAEGWEAFYLDRGVWFLKRELPAG